MVNELLSRWSPLAEVYVNGQRLHKDRHFKAHIIHGVPIQIYLDNVHQEIGFIERFTKHYVRINNVDYDRTRFTFISRPGY